MMTRRSAGLIKAHLQCVSAREQALGRAAGYAIMCRGRQYSHAVAPASVRCRVHRRMQAHPPSLSRPFRLAGEEQHASVLIVTGGDLIPLQQIAAAAAKGMSAQATVSQLLALPP